MKDLLKALYERVMKTRNARFEASRRMARCDRFSNGCIAFLSLEIITINIFQMVSDTSINTLSSINFVGAATVILSVFALVLSLIVNQAQYSVKNHIYTQCALTLDALAYDLNRVLKSGQTIDDKLVEHFNKKYMSIRMESNLNHEECDHQWATRKSDTVKEEFDYETNPVSYNLFRIKLWWSHWIFSTYFMYLTITLLGALIVSCLLLDEFL